MSWATQDPESFRQSLRSWLDTHCPQAMRDGLNTEATICWGGKNWQFISEDQKLWMQNAAEVGLTTPRWPAAYGGAGLSREQDKIYLEELARINARMPLLSFGIWMLGPALLAFGSEAQKQKYLPQIIRGEQRWCQGYSEPGAGSDLANVQTKAEDMGDHYLINGQKIWTSYADKADWIFALVRTSHEDVKQQGITFLCAPMNSPGIEVHPIITIDGRHSLNRVTFDNVRVPVQNRIGEEGQGWHYANFLLGNERTSYAHVAGKRMQMAAIEQFMESIGEQDHQAQFNELSVRLDTLDVTVLRVLATVANGESPGNESSILKIMATELAQDITELGMVVRQYAGIASFSAEMPDRAGAKAMVDYLGTRSQSIYGGSNEIQKNIIAKRVLGL